MRGEGMEEGEGFVRLTVLATEGRAEMSGEVSDHWGFDVVQSREQRERLRR